MFRDAFWISALFVVMAVISISGLSHSSAFNSASFAPLPPEAMVEVEAQQHEARLNEDTASPLSLATIKR